jgi:hypothetical protein
VVATAVMTAVVKAVAKAVTGRQTVLVYPTSTVNDFEC